MSALDDSRENSFSAVPNSCLATSFFTVTLKPILVNASAMESASFAGFGSSPTEAYFEFPMTRATFVPVPVPVSVDAAPEVLQAAERQASPNTLS